MNNMTVTGNLTRDPELRFTPSGVAVTNFTIADNRKNPETGEYDLASFIDVTVWREQAENVAESLTKGDHAIVSGYIKQDTWQDEETGADRSKLTMTANDVGVCLRFATAQPVKASGNRPAPPPPSDLDSPF